VDGELLLLREPVGGLFVRSGQASAARIMRRMIGNHNGFARVSGSTAAHKFPVFGGIQLLATP